MSSREVVVGVALDPMGEVGVAVGVGSNWQ